MSGRVAGPTEEYDNSRNGPAPRPAAALETILAPQPPGTSAPAPAPIEPDPELEPPLPEPGTRIGQYEIIRELGRGGMGAVYAARDTKLGRKVAIKFLSSNNPELTARFIVEARATARCNHENIIVIYEVGEHRGSPFMVLEFLQGAPLTQLLQDGRKLPPAQAVELMVPVVRALTVAHEASPGAPGADGRSPDRHGHQGR